MRKTTMKSSGPMAPPAKSSLIETFCSPALFVEVSICFFLCRKIQNYFVKMSQTDALSNDTHGSRKMGFFH
jgi:hypothetical protein